MPRTRPLSKKEMAICHRITEFREMLGITRAELARRSGINRFTLASHERGLAKIKPKHKATLARVTGINLKWLETGEGSAGCLDPTALPPTWQEVREEMLQLSRKAGVQSLIAGRTGFSLPQLHRWIHGNREPRASVAFALFKALVEIRTSK